jgi:hypothetical protein
LEERFEASRFEQADHCFVGGNDGWASAVEHGCTIDVIAAVLIDNEYALVTGDAVREELASLIGVDHAGGALTIIIDGTGANGGGLRRCGIVIGIRVHGWLLWAGEGIAAVLSWSSYETGQGDLGAWPLTVVDICELRRM